MLFESRLDPFLSWLSEMEIPLHKVQLRTQGPAAASCCLKGKNLISCVPSYQLLELCSGWMQLGGMMQTPLEWQKLCIGHEGIWSFSSITCIVGKCIESTFVMALGWKYWQYEGDSKRVLKKKKTNVFLFILEARTERKKIEPLLMLISFPKCSHQVRLRRFKAESW